VACGKGRLIHSDGDIYEGEWRNDKAHGYVIIYNISRANMFIWMELNILDNGKMIDKMEREKKYGLMVLVIRANIKMEKKMVEVFLNGLMVQSMLENFFKITYKDRVNIVGKMEENMLVNGKIIKWMGEEYIYYIIFKVFTWLDGRRYEG
jgi:hypothetical protein